MAAAKKVQKEQERVERAAIMAEKRKVAAEVRATKEAEKQARAAAKKKASKQKQQQLGQKEQSIRPIKPPKALKKQAKGLIREVEVQEVEVVVTATSRGRQVQKPGRFYK